MANTMAEIMIIQERDEERRALTYAHTAMRNALDEIWMAILTMLSRRCDKLLIVLT